MFAHFGPNLQFPCDQHVSVLPCAIFMHVRKPAIPSRELAFDSKNSRGKRRSNLCKVLADILGRCSQVVAEGACGACLTCTLAEEFAGHV